MSSLIGVPFTSASCVLRPVSGARTSLFVPELDRLYLGFGPASLGRLRFGFFVPHREIRMRENQGRARALDPCRAPE